MAVIGEKHWFSDDESIRSIDARRIVYLFIFLASFLVTEIGRIVYRPYIYENKINDFGLADSIGNLGGIIVQFFFGLVIFNSPKKKGYRLLFFFVVGYILYEIAQPYLPKGVFDWKDVYGTIIGGVFALIIYWAIHLVLKKNRILIRF